VANFPARTLSRPAFDAAFSERHSGGDARVRSELASAEEAEGLVSQGAAEAIARACTQLRVDEFVASRASDRRRSRCRWCRF
jgi:hypothetical protein